MTEIGTNLLVAITVVSITIGSTIGVIITAWINRKR